MSVYPTEPLYRLRDAILADDKKTGAEATIDLIAGVLSDIRRIADALENANELETNRQVHTGEYRGG